MPNESNFVLESVTLSGTQGDDQQLVDLLTENDEGNSTQAIRERSRRKVVPAFCATRWTARVSTLSTLLAKYVTVLKTLEKNQRQQCWKFIIRLCIIYSFNGGFIVYCGFGSGIVHPELSSLCYAGTSEYRM